MKVIFKIKKDKKFNLELDLNRIPAKDECVILPINKIYDLGSFCHIIDTRQNMTCYVKKVKTIIELTENKGTLDPEFQITYEVTLEAGFTNNHKAL